MRARDQPAERVNGFSHRYLLGWVSAYVTRSLPGPWPQIPFGEPTEACTAHCDGVVWGGSSEFAAWRNGTGT